MLIHELTDPREICRVLRTFSGTLGSLRTGRVEPETYSRKLAAHGRVLLARDGDTEPGFAAFYCNDAAGRTAYLAMIAVDPRYRGRHLGTALLTAAEEISRQQGMEGLRLEVEKSNREAMLFYGRRGYSLLEDGEASCYLYKKFEEGV